MYNYYTFNEPMVYGHRHYGTWSSGGGKFMPHSYPFNSPLACDPPCYASCVNEGGVIICGCKCPNQYQIQGFSCDPPCYASCVIEDGVIICGCKCSTPYQPHQYYK